MEWFNPVEWSAWVYGRFVQHHPTRGGIIVFTVSGTICGLIALALWARGVDKYEEDHSPKTMAVAQGDQSTQQDLVTASNEQIPAGKSAVSRAKVPIKKSPPHDQATEEPGTHQQSTNIEIRENTILHLPVSTGSQPSDDQVNSAIENAGMTENISISGVKVTAPPSGRATLLRTLPGGKTDHIEVKDGTVSSPPAHSRQQQHGAFLKIGPNSGMDRVLMERNTYCDSDSLIANGGGSLTSVTARRNTAYDCDWASFVGWLTEDRDDEKTNQRLLWWETRLETTWAGDELSLEQ